MRRRVALALLAGTVLLAFGSAANCRKKPSESKKEPWVVPTRFVHYASPTPLPPGVPTPIPDEPQ
jgi:hypothetical protein